MQEGEEQQRQSTGRHGGENGSISSAKCHPATRKKSERGKITTRRGK